MKNVRGTLICGITLVAVIAFVMPCALAQNNQERADRPPRGGQGGPGALFPSSEQMDLDKDGTVTKAEFTSAWNDACTKMFKRFDTDENGTLSKDELDKLPGPKNRMGRGPDPRNQNESAASGGPPEGNATDRPVGPPPDGKARRMGPPRPEEMDTDNDGNVTQQEYKVAWDKFIQAQFSRMDKDESGTLSDEELEQGRPGPPPGPPPAF